MSLLSRIRPHGVVGEGSPSPLAIYLSKDETRPFGGVLILLAGMT